MIVDVLGESIAIETRNRKNARVLESLLRNITLGRGRRQSTTAVPVSGDSPDEVVRALNQRALRPADPSLVVLHSGWVERDGRGILVAGPSFCGKSTIVAALCLFGGAHYGSDEITALRIGAAAGVPFAKPPVLKRSSWPVIERRLGDDIGWRGEATWLVPPTAVSTELAAPDIEPAFVVFPAYCGCLQTDVTPVSPAEAAFRLCSLATNLEDVSTAGFRTICELARGCPSYELKYGDAELATAALEAELAR